MQPIQRFSDKCHFLITYGDELGDFMPWHGTNSPSRIIIAEILLRRTTRTVAQKLYKDFFESFSSLIEVNRKHRGQLVEILKPGGLYNQRANQIIELADKLRLKGFDEIPNDLQIIKNLPGIGQYSSEAVLLYAFSKSFFPIDGGIHRVIRRLISHPVSKGSTNLKSTKRTQYSKDKIVQAIKSFLQEKYEGKVLIKIHKAMLKISWAWCLENPCCEECKANKVCDYYTINFE